jgi:hypothetical protein
MLKLNYAVRKDIQDCPITMLSNDLIFKIWHDEQLL